VSNHVTEAAVGTACCPPLAVAALDAAAAERIAPLFKALGDPVRLRLMSMIASTDEVCVCDLTVPFDVSAPTVSHHLRVLREVGLVSAERRGTWVYYRARPDVVELLSDLLRVPSSIGSAPRPAERP
jgi:ArsR family transcriptional regulator